MKKIAKKRELKTLQPAELSQVRGGGGLKPGFPGSLEQYSGFKPGNPADTASGLPTGQRM